MRHQHAGFTLVELLVVIAIIVVVLAMLAPAMDRAMDGAQRAVCASNLHALGLAAHHYRADHRKKFPSAAATSQVTGPVVTYARWGGKQGTEYPDGDRLINPYVGINQTATLSDNHGPFRVFRCPSDNGAGPGGWAASRKPTIYDCLGSSYVFNSSGNNNDTSGLWNKSNVTSPGRCVYATDYSFTAWFVQTRYPPRVPFQTSYWHDPAETQVGWGNILFVDSHVAFLLATPDEPDHQNGAGYTFRTDR